MGRRFYSIESFKERRYGSFGSTSIKSCRAAARDCGSRGGCLFLGKYACGDLPHIKGFHAVALSHFGEFDEDFTQKGEVLLRIFGEVVRMPPEVIGKVVFCGKLKGSGDSSQPQRLKGGGNASVGSQEAACRDVQW